MTRSSAAFAAALVFLSSAPDAGAEDFRLELPLDCALGLTCFVEDYVDQDLAIGARQDFACGNNTRDSHTGTDFALLSFEAIGTGIAVYAAADGTVTATRDSMPDDRLMRGVTSSNACGNAVIVAHDGGWRSQYCHLRLGSVTVAAGDVVQAGDPLGFVGLSGQTNHPHLHFTLRRGGSIVDPFRPEATGTCGPPGDTLWDLDIPYTPTGFFTAGFADHMPTKVTVRSGAARTAVIAPDAPIVLYIYAHQTEAGDTLRFNITGPAGEVIHQSDVALDTAQPDPWRGVGKRAPASGWPTGDYQGSALLLRGDTVIAHRFAHVTVDQ